MAQFFECDERILSREANGFICQNVLNYGKLCEWVPIAECPQKKAYVDLMQEKHNKKILKDEILCLHCQHSSHLVEKSMCHAGSCNSFPYCHQDISVEYMLKYVPDYPMYQKLVKMLSRSLHDEIPEEFSSVVRNCAIITTAVFFLTNTSAEPTQSWTLLVAWFSILLIACAGWFVVWTVLSSIINEILTDNNQRYAFVRKHVENVQEKSSTPSILPLIDSSICAIVTLVSMILILKGINIC